MVSVTVSVTVSVKTSAKRGGSVTVSVRTTAKRASNDPEVLNDKLNAGWSVGSFVLVPIVDRRLLSGVPSRRSLAMMPDHNGSLKIKGRRSTFALGRARQNDTSKRIAWCVLKKADENTPGL